MPDMPLGNYGQNKKTSQNVNVLNLKELPYTLAICKLKPNQDLPVWIRASAFYSVTKTSEELSIVCEQSIIPKNIECNKDWKAFKVEGLLDFSLTGILASIANPLAKNKISIFAVSTFDTDYILVKSESWIEAKLCLEKTGFKFI